MCRNESLPRGRNFKAWTPTTVGKDGDLDTKSRQHPPHNIGCRIASYRGPRRLSFARDATVVDTGIGGGVVRPSEKNEASAMGPRAKAEIAGYRWTEQPLDGPPPNRALCDPAQRDAFHPTDALRSN